MSAMSDPAPLAETVDITSSDHTMTKAPSCRGIFVGTGGDVKVVMAGDGQDQTFPDVADGVVLPIQATKVYRTGTGASGLVALF